jgi:hypothetical protein
LKKYKIYEIEFVFSEGKNKKIKVSDYLNMQEEAVKLKK